MSCVVFVFRPTDDYEDLLTPPQTTATSLRYTTTTTKPAAMAVNEVCNYLMTGPRGLLGIEKEIRYELKPDSYCRWLLHTPAAQPKTATIGYTLEYDLCQLPQFWRNIAVYRGRSRSSAPVALRNCLGKVKVVAEDILITFLPGDKSYANFTIYYQRFSKYLKCFLYIFNSRNYNVQCQCVSHQS